MHKLLLIVLCASLISACTAKSSTNINNSPTPTPTTPTTPEKSITSVESTYEEDLGNVSPKIKNSNEFKSCMNMNVRMCVQNAGMQLAQANKSTEICNELSTPDQKDGCIFAVTILKLQDSSDKKLCDGLNETYKSQCIKIATKNEAIKKNDIRICESLVVKETGTGTNLTGVPDMSADECIMGVIMADANATIKACDTIKSAQMKEMCKMSIRSKKEMENTTNITIPN